MDEPGGSSPRASEQTLEEVRAVAQAAAEAEALVAAAAAAGEGGEARDEIHASGSGAAVNSSDSELLHALSVFHSIAAAGDHLDPPLALSAMEGTAGDETESEADEAPGGGAARQKELGHSAPDQSPPPPQHLPPCLQKMAATLATVTTSMNAFAVCCALHISRPGKTKTSPLLTVQTPAHEPWSTSWSSAGLSGDEWSQAFAMAGRSSLVEDRRFSKAFLPTSSVAVSAELQEAVEYATRELCVPVLGLQTAPRLALRGLWLASFRSAMAVDLPAMEGDAFGRAMVWLPVVDKAAARSAGKLTSPTSLSVAQQTPAAASSSMAGDSLPAGKVSPPSAGDTEGTPTAAAKQAPKNVVGHWTAALSRNSHAMSSYPLHGCSLLAWFRGSGLVLQPPTGAVSAQSRCAAVLFDLYHPPPAPQYHDYTASTLALERQTQTWIQLLPQKRWQPPSSPTAAAAASPAQSASTHLSPVSSATHISPIAMRHQPQQETSVPTTGNGAAGTTQPQTSPEPAPLTRVPAKVFLPLCEPDYDLDSLSFAALRKSDRARSHMLRAVSDAAGQPALDLWLAVMQPANPRLGIAHRMVSWSNAAADLQLRFDLEQDALIWPRLHTPAGSSPAGPELGEWRLSSTTAEDSAPQVAAAAVVVGDGNDYPKSSKRRPVIDAATASHGQRRAADSADAKAASGAGESGADKTPTSSDTEDASSAHPSAAKTSWPSTFAALVFWPRCARWQIFCCKDSICSGTLLVFLQHLQQSGESAAELQHWVETACMVAGTLPPAEHGPTADAIVQTMVQLEMAPAAVRRGLAILVEQRPALCTDSFVVCLQHFSDVAHEAWPDEIFSLLAASAFGTQIAVVYWLLQQDVSPERLAPLMDMLNATLLRVQNAGADLQGDILVTAAERLAAIRLCALIPALNLAAAEYVAHLVGLSSSVRTLHALLRDLQAMRRRVLTAENAPQPAATEGTAGHVSQQRIDRLSRALIGGHIKAVLPLSDASATFQAASLVEFGGEPEFWTAAGEMFALLSVVRQSCPHLLPVCLHTLQHAHPAICRHILAHARAEAWPATDLQPLIHERQLQIQAQLANYAAADDQPPAGDSSAEPATLALLPAVTYRGLDLPIQEFLVSDRRELRYHPPLPACFDLQAAQVLVAQLMSNMQTRGYTITCRIVVLHAHEPDLVSTGPTSIATQAFRADQSSSVVEVRVTRARSRSQRPGHPGAQTSQNEESATTMEDASDGIAAAAAYRVAAPASASEEAATASSSHAPTPYTPAESEALPADRKQVVAEEAAAAAGDVTEPIRDVVTDDESADSSGEQSDESFQASGKRPSSQDRSDSEWKPKLWWHKRQQLDRKLRAALLMPADPSSSRVTGTIMGRSRRQDRARNPSTQYAIDIFKLDSPVTLKATLQAELTWLEQWQQGN